MKNRRVIAVLCVAFVASIGAFLSSRGNSIDTTTPVKDELVTPSKPERSMIYGIGYVEPKSGVRRLAFSAGGRIKKWHVQVGQKVKAGTRLVELDSTDIEAEIVLAAQILEQARAERSKLLSGANPHRIEAAKHTVENCRQRMLLAQSIHERHEKLPSQALSRIEFDRTRAELSQCKAEFEKATADLAMLENHVRPEDRTLADARVAVAEATLTNAKQKLQDRVIVAPTDGEVLERVRREGESVSSVEPSPVAVFANRESLQVRVEVDERFVSQLQTGMETVVTGNGLGNRELSGRVQSIRELMGKKTVFSRSAEERKELDVIQLVVGTEQPLTAPIGLRLDVRLLSN